MTNVTQAANTPQKAKECKTKQLGELNPNWPPGAAVTNQFISFGCVSCRVTALVHGKDACGDISSSSSAQHILMMMVLLTFFFTTTQHPL